MIDVKTVLDSMNVATKIKDFFSPKNETEVEQLTQADPEPVDIGVVGLNLTNEQLAIISISAVAIVAIIAIAVVASQRGMIQA